MKQKLQSLGFIFNQHEIGYNSKYSIRVMLEATPHKMVGYGQMITFTNYDEFELAYNRLRSYNCGNCG